MRLSEVQEYAETDEDPGLRLNRVVSMQIKTGQLPIHV